MLCTCYCWESLACYRLPTHIYRQLASVIQAAVLVGLTFQKCRTPAAPTASNMPVGLLLWRGGGHALQVREPFLRHAIPLPETWAFVPGGSLHRQCPARSRPVITTGLGDRGR